MSRGDLPPLTRERQRLVVMVSGTVAAIALTLATEIGDGGWFDDLCSAGHVGASEAAQRYDFASDTPFEGFAWPRISGAMIDLLRRERLRLSPKLRAALDKVVAALEGIAEYAAEVHDESAGDVDVEEEAAGAAAAAGVGLLCLGASGLDPEKALLQKEQLTHLEAALALLSERDRAMIALRYLERWTMEAVADHFGIHKATALKRLKDALRRLGARLRPIFLVPEPE